MGKLNEDSGPVDNLLDEMFDRLSGTGATGRRLLAEAEDHLRAATAAGRERGLSTLDAEREAVGRFGGPAAGVPAPAGALRVVRLALVGWTVLALVTLSSGVASLFGRVFSFAFVPFLAANGDFGVDNAADPCSTPYLPQPVTTCTVPPSGSFSEQFVVPLPTIATSLLLVVAGVVMLGPLLLARRSRNGALVPSRRALADSVTVLFAPLGIALIALSSLESIAMVYALDAGGPAGPWSRVSLNLSAGLIALSVATVALRLRRSVAVRRRPRPVGLRSTAGTASL